jgi:hypothetical protein
MPHLPHRNQPCMHGTEEPVPTAVPPLPGTTPNDVPPLPHTAKPLPCPRRLGPLSALDWPAQGAYTGERTVRRSDAVTARKTRRQTDTPPTRYAVRKSRQEAHQPRRCKIVQRGGGVSPRITPLWGSTVNQNRALATTRQTAICPTVRLSL